MSFADKIPVMKFELVKASIASLLVAERNNQLALLAAPPYELSSTVIDNDYDFNVFKDAFAVPDASELPCINVYNKDGAFDAGKGYTDSKWHTYNLAVDCYSISCAEPEADASKLASARLDYLWGQAFGILSSEENWHKGLKDIIRVARFTDWQQKIVVIGSDEAAEQILTIQSTLELQFEEPTERVSGEPLEELVASLEIDEQFISPFVTKILT